VDFGGGAHLEPIPQRAGLIDALEPRHPVVGRRDEHDDELRAPLPLRRRPLLVGDLGAGEDRVLELPPILDSSQIPP